MRARLAAVLRRLAISAVLTAVLLVVSCAAMYVTFAPRIVSLLIEPFSLLLMPGLVVAIVMAGAHDFTPISVVCVAAIFYFCFFYLALAWRAKAARFTQPGSR